MTDKGVVYVAFGVEYVLMAAFSCFTLKRSNPGINVCLVTNVDFSEISIGSEALFDSVKCFDDVNENNREYKVTLPINTPFDKTLYLDCDTYVYGDVSPIFHMLEFHPLLIKQNSYPTRKKVKVMGASAIELGLQEFNSGVIGFQKHEDVTLFFKEWRRAMIALKRNQDQYSLCKIIYDGRVKPPFNLPVVFNAKYTDEAEKTLIDKGRCVIFHYREIFDFPNLSREYMVFLKELTIKSKAELDFMNSIEKLLDLSGNAKAAKRYKSEVHVSRVSRPAGADF